MALASGAVGLGGCAIPATRVAMEGTVVHERPVVATTAVVADISRYPRVYYRDRYVYLIDGYWYYPSRQGWTVLREEPRELYRYRMRTARPSSPEPPAVGYPTPPPRERGRQVPLRAPEALPPVYPAPPPRGQTDRGRDEPLSAPEATPHRYRTPPRRGYPAPPPRGNHESGCDEPLRAPEAPPSGLPTPPPRR